MRKGKKRWSLILTVCMLAGLWPNVTEVSAQDVQEHEVIINAAEYGADPTGMEDSARAIQEAFSAAKKAKDEGADHVTVSFPKGEYHIYKDYAEKREYHTSNTSSTDYPEKTIGLLIEDQKDFTLDGNGSLFMMHGNMMALAVVRSENVTLKDFSWDFAVPTASEMTITGMGTDNEGKAYTDFFIPKCCPFEIQNNTIRWHSEPSPYTGEYYWTRTGIHEDSYSIVAMHPDEEMVRAYFTNETPFGSVSSIEKLDDTSIRIHYSASRPAMQKIGMVLQFVSSAVRETAGAFTWESKNVTARNVNVHYMHGFGWLIQMSTDVYYYDCNLMPRENSGHTVVSYADGIHASGAAGDLVIENCNFSNTHDDPINLHGTFTRVEERIDDHTLKLKYIHRQQGGFPQFHKGDQVAFFTRDTLESTDNETLYTVEKVMSNPGEGGNDLKTMQIRFAEALPANLTDKIGNEPKYVAENVTYAPKVIIRGCTFKNVDTRGILCTTRQPVLIENNTFLNMSMATIYLSNDSNDWYESGPIRDMTIRNNTFYIKDIGRTSWEYASAIYVHPVTKGGGLPSEENPIHKNITIEGNTFHMDLDTVVKAESVENLSIRNNKILRMNPDISLAVSAERTDLAAGDTVTLSTQAEGNSNTGVIDNVYEFTKCKNVVIEGNTYDDGLKRYAVLSGMSESNLTNHDAEITIASNRNQPASNPVERIYYESSDDAVAEVDENGRVTAKKAGAAWVYACYAWNGTKIISNKIKISVAGSTDTPEEPEDLTDTTIEGISIEELSFEKESFDEKSWFLNAESGKNKAVLKIRADERIGEIRVLEGAYRKALQLSETEEGYCAPLNFKYGLNSYYIQVWAKDGITMKQYMVHVNYTASSEVSVNQILINGKELPEFDEDQKDYRITLDKGEPSIRVKVEGTGACTKISVNGEVSEGSEITFDRLREGANDIRIVTAAEDGIEKKTYKIQAVLPYDSNAEMFDIQLNDQSIMGNFKDNTQTIVIPDHKVKIKAVAEDERAIVKVTNGVAVGYGQGSIEKEIPLYQGRETVEITAFSLNGGKDSTYTVHFEGGAYLSDLTWEDGATVGYGIIMKDKASSGSSIRLADSDGNPVTYEKGVGTHVVSSISWQIADGGFSSLEGLCGVDYAKYSSGDAKIRFVILADGEEVFNSGTMLGNTPGKEFKIPVEGVSGVTLKAEQAGTNNWDAHADWAVMKLSKDFGAAPEVSADIQDLEAELKKNEKMDLSENTPEKIAEYITAMQEAYAVMESAKKGNAVGRDQITSAIESVTAAVDQIKKELADKPTEETRNKLQSKLNQYKKISSALYTAESYAGLQNLIQTIESKLDTYTEKEMQNQIKALDDAYNRLVKLPQTKAPAAGDEEVVDNVRYQILDVNKKTAAAVGMQNKSASKIVILDTVKISNLNCNVVQISKNAFQKSAKLRQVTVGGSVTVIGKNAFKQCKKLKKVILKGTALKKVQGGAFKNTAKKAAVKWPKGLKGKKKNALKNKLKKAGLKIK